MVNQSNIKEYVTTLTRVKYTYVKQNGSKELSHKHGCFVCVFACFLASCLIFMLVCKALFN